MKHRRFMPTHLPRGQTRLPLTTSLLRRCRVCGCTDDNCTQCIQRTGHPCHWIASDLCSACPAELQAA